MNKFKIILSVLTGLLFLVALLVIGIIFILPGAKDLKNQIGSYKKENQNKIETSAMSNSTPAEMQTTQDQINNEVEDKSAAEADVSQQKQEDTLEEFINPQKPLIQFCENLSSAANSSFWEKGTGSQFGQYMSDHMLDEKKDPYLETILPALKYAMRGEEMGRLFKMVKSSDEKKEEGFFDKAEFYTQMAFAVNEVRSRRQKTEELIDRTYLLFALANAVKKKPELLNDTGTLDFCNRIQNGIIDDANDDIEANKRNLADFLHFAGLKNEDVKYDPNYKTALQIKSNNNSIQFSGGWIDQYAADSNQQSTPDENATKTLTN